MFTLIPEDFWVQLFRAFRAKAMAEFYFGMVSNMDLEESSSTINTRVRVIISVSLLAVCCLFKADGGDCATVVAEGQLSTQVVIYERLYQV